MFGAGKRGQGKGNPVEERGSANDGGERIISVLARYIRVYYLKRGGETNGMKMYLTMAKTLSAENYDQL